MIGVSVVICCHNSSDRLPSTINHLNEIITSQDIEWELIIVDNASTDNTSGIAAQLLSPALTKRTKIVPENLLGLKNARLRGITESQYEYISFIDDDNWICPDWVSIVFEVMTEHPEVGACGGGGWPAFEAEPPFWFEQYKLCYAVGSQGDLSGYVSDSVGYLWGAGLTFRRSALDEIFNYGFSYNLFGRHGKNLSAGEDCELCFAIRCCGWRLWYDERLKYYHFLPEFRLKWDYFKKMQKGFGAANAILDIYRDLLNSKPNECQDFNNVWIRDSWAIARYLFAKHAKHLFGLSEGEGSPIGSEFHHLLGKLTTILKLRRKYDEIKKQIYEFWQLSESNRL